MRTRLSRLPRTANGPRTHTRAGGALVMALIVVLLAAMFTTSTLQLTSAVTKRQTQDVDNLRAFYLSEAGLSESFEALRTGRRGQIGSIGAPAVIGDGFVWVDAMPTEDGKLRLESTAVCGTGRSTLALTVEPVEIPLGIFSEEDIVVDTVLLVDGFDSSAEEPYVEPLPELQRVVIEEADFENDLYTVFPEYNVLFYGDTFYAIEKAQPPSFGYLKSVQGPRTKEQYYIDGDYDPAVVGDYYTCEADCADCLERTLLTVLDELGIKSVTQVPVDADALAGSGILAEIPTIEGAAGADWTSWLNGEAETQTNQELGSSSGFEESTAVELSPQDSVELDVSDGALIGSNGSITIGGAGEAIEIYGDLVPGVDKQVTIADDSFVSGETTPRTDPIELAAVEIPWVEMQAPVRQEDILPMVVSPGSIGYESIQVTADTELIIRGPATVVIGALSLEPGAELTLDTADGKVELYILQELDLMEGSTVTTSGQSPNALSVQVSANDTTSADPAVQLMAQSQFYGTIYAPEAEVVVGGEFELFGSMAARVLDLKPGAKLHYDRDVAELIPRVLSWKISQVPAPVRTMNPWGQVDRSTLLPLSEAHDLGGIQLTVDYMDTTGTTRSYTGAEEDFNWNAVDEVLAAERSGWDDWDKSWYKDWWSYGDWNWEDIFSDWADYWGSSSGTSSWGSGG